MSEVPLYVDLGRGVAATWHAWMQLGGFSAKGIAELYHPTHFGVPSALQTHAQRYRGTPLIRNGVGGWAPPHPLGRSVGPANARSAFSLIRISSDFEWGQNPPLNSKKVIQINSVSVRS